MTSIGLVYVLFKLGAVAVGNATKNQWKVWFSKITVVGVILQPFPKCVTFPIQLWYVVFGKFEPFFAILSRRAVFNKKYFYYKNSQ